MKMLLAIFTGAVCGFVVGLVVGVIVPNNILEPGIAPIVGMLAGAVPFEYGRRTGRMFR